MPDDIDELLNQARQVGISSDDSEGSSGSGWWDSFKSLYDTADKEWLPDYESMPFGKGAKALEDKGWKKSAQVLRAVTKPQHWAAEQLVGSPLRAASTAGSIATLGAGSVLPAAAKFATASPKLARGVSAATRAVDAAGGMRGMQDAVELGKEGNYGQAAISAGAGALGFLGAGSNPLAKGVSSTPLPMESPIPNPKAILPKLPKVAKGKMKPGNPVTTGIEANTPLLPQIAKTELPVDTPSGFQPALKEAKGITPPTDVNNDILKGRVIDEIMQESGADWPTALKKAQEDGTLVARLEKAKATPIKDSTDYELAAFQGKFNEPVKSPSGMNDIGGIGSEPYQPAGMGRSGTAVNPIARERQLVPELQEAKPNDAFKWWVNHRETARAAGSLKAKEFSKYDGITFTDYQNSPETVAPELSQYFKLKHAELQNAGVKLGEKENYLPQVWENPELVDSLSKDQRRKLSLKPGFTFEALIDNYEEGIKLKLKPKFKNLSELAGHYEASSAKAIADRQFFDYLKENKLIKKAGDLETKGWKAQGWKEVDFDFFPQARLVRKGSDGSNQSELTRWIISPQALAGKKMFTGNVRHLTDSIQNYLDKPNAFLEHAATVASVPKNVVLSGGIPTTGINFHGWNTLVRKTFQAENKSKEFLSGAWDLANPKRAEARLATLEQGMLDARRHGLVATTEGMNPDKYLAKAVQDLGPYAKLEGKLDELFAVPLFGKVLPAWKLEMYDKLAKGFIEPGMTPLQIASAKREAAKQTNDFYGGINWKELGESKNMQNTLRATLLAPDWLRSNYRVGKGVVEALQNPKDPKGAAYRKAMGTLMGAYVAANMANRVVTGKWTWQNDPGHEFDVVVGEDSKGRLMYARPFGTAADFARVPFQIAHSIAMGKPGDVGNVVLNRSSIPARQAWDWTAGDYRGDSLFTDRYNQPKDMQQVAGTLAEDAKGFLPGFVQGPIDRARGEISTPQMVSRVVEAPIGFAFPKQEEKKKKKKKKGSVSFR